MTIYCMSLRADGVQMPYSEVINQDNLQTEELRCSKILYFKNIVTNVLKYDGNYVAENAVVFYMKYLHLMTEE